MENLFSKNILVGIKIGAFSPGTQSITDNKEALQALTLHHPAGTVVKLHTHTPQERITETLQECLVVRKGKIEIKLYDGDKTHIADVTLAAGEAFILLCGMWSVHFIKDSEVFEIKNGPYRDDRAAVVI